MKSTFYYQRRFSLTILYIIMGMLFLTFPIMGLLEPSSKNDLHFFSGVPEKFSLEYQKQSKEEYIKLLIVEINGKSLKMLISNKESKLLTKSLGDIKFVKRPTEMVISTPIKKVRLNNSFIEESDLDKINLEGNEWKQVIRELKINNIEIILFEETSSFFYLVLIVVGLSWLFWQLKILLFVIKKKPKDIYS